jgi:hypothetical protein
MNIKSQDIPTTPTVIPSYVDSTYILRSNGFQMVRLADHQVWKPLSHLINDILEEGIVSFNCQPLTENYSIKGLVGVKEHNTYQNFTYDNFYAIVVKKNISKTHYLYLVDSDVKYQNGNLPDTTCSFRYAYEASTLEILMKHIIDPDVKTFLKSSSDYWKQTLS